VTGLPGESRRGVLLETPRCGSIVDDVASVQGACRTSPCLEVPKHLSIGWQVADDVQDIRSGEFPLAVLRKTMASNSPTGSEVMPASNLLRIGVVLCLIGLGIGTALAWGWPTPVTTCSDSPDCPLLDSF